MNIASIKPSCLDGIKNLAKKLKRDQGIRHTEALEVASRQAGYQSFVHARRSLSIVGTCASPRHFPVYLTAHWRELRQTSLGSNGISAAPSAGIPRRRAGRELLQVNLTRPLQSVISKHRVSKAQGLGVFVMEYDDHLEMHYLAESQQRARELLLSAERALRFMDVTGLQPVSLQTQRDRLRPLNDLPGHDHTSNWFDSATGSIAMLDEPYAGALKLHTAERALQLARAAFSEIPLPWDGIYNPGITKPYLISKDSALLTRVANAVSALPSYAFPDSWPDDTGVQGDAFVSPQRIRDGKVRRPIPNASYTNRMGATPYGGGFGTRSRWRPTQPMAPALHMELGSILYRLADFDVPWKVRERLRTTFRSELENWANYEHPSTEVGYKAYYDQGSLERFKTRQEHIAAAKRAKEIVMLGYDDCKPRRELIAAIEAYAVAVES